MTNDEITQSIKNIENLLKTLVRFHFAEIKGQAFSNETEEKAYSLTGIKGRDQICEDLKISPNTLSDLWSRWFSLGLLVKERGSYKRTIE
jgi:hypothetical protein